MDILMPQLGETVAEGTIIKWLKAVGDTITSGESLFEVETDKVTMEVPCMTSGVVTAINLFEGETAPIGAVVAVIDGPDSSPTSEPAAALSSSAPTEAPVAATAPIAAAPVRPARLAPIDPFRGVRSPAQNFGSATRSDGAKITPLARRLAAEAGIDVNGVTGSGPHGRIVAADIRNASVVSVPVPTAEPAAIAAPSVTEERDQVLTAYAGTRYEEVPLDGMRRTISRRLVQAKQTIPHFYLSTEVELDHMLALRAQINAAATAGLKISVNDLVVKAFALALKAVPQANSVWAGDRILRLQQVDIGVAVSVEGGLFTPVVRDVDTQSLSSISATIKDLAARAKDRRLKPAEYQGGSASVSNLGMFGTRDFSAIINPPQSSILAVGAAERRATEATDGSVRFTSRMTVTLSCDHRVIDGAVGAELLSAFKGLIEEPFRLVI
ncbi:MAG: dihydrolipoamide acetyltransferase family protein [Janthinobacterium lividum]